MFAWRVSRSIPFWRLTCNSHVKTVMTSDIYLEGIEKQYGSIPALKGIDLVVGKGERFGLIGPDGAGKTSLMRILCGLIRPDGGRFTVAGFDGLREIRSIKSSVGYMPQRFSLYPDLTVRENIRFFADLFGVTGDARTTREKRLMQFSRLGPFSDRRASALSGGMKQKLALSCALIHTPSILILDEPTTGVDPLSRREFWEILKELSEDENVTILVSTPYLDEAAKCHRVAFMNRGEIIDSGTPEILSGRYPYQVVVVQAPDLFQLKHRLAAVPGIHSIVVLGDHLRVSLRNDVFAGKSACEWLREQGLEKAEIREDKPILEDVFVYCLQKDQELAGDSG
jgi:drug efflux transport system ATP-binding protein